MILEAHIKITGGYTWVLGSESYDNSSWWEVFGSPPEDELLERVLSARMEIAESAKINGCVLPPMTERTAVSPYIRGDKRARKSAMVHYVYALAEYLGATDVALYKLKKGGNMKPIPKPETPAFARMPAQHGRQGERAEIRLPNGDVFNYELWTSAVDGFWLCEEADNGRVFNELRMEPEGYCLKYYTPRGGSWPAVSLKEYPDWRKRLLDAMVGFTEYGCAVTMYDKDDIRVHHLPRCGPATSPEDRITAVVTIGGKQYEHQLHTRFDAAWWNYCDGPNVEVFHALDIDPNKHCAEYYTEVGSGHWPYISTDEPDWEDKLRDAILGLAQYGAEVVVTYPDGKQYKSEKRFRISEHTPTASTWSPEEKETIKKYLNSLIQQL